MGGREREGKSEQDLSTDKLLPSSWKKWRQTRENTNSEILANFLGGPVVKNPLSNAGNVGLTPGWASLISQLAKNLPAKLKTLL